MTVADRSHDPICAELRQIRTNLGLSLEGVEARSGGRWKGVVVGSWERGDRRPTFEGIRELLNFYGSLSDGIWSVAVLAPGDVVVRAKANAAGSRAHVEWLVVYGPNFDGEITCDDQAEAERICSHWPGSAVGYRTHHLGPISYPAGAA